MIFGKASLPRTGILLCAVLFFLQACATLHPDYEQPTVTLSSFQVVPSDGMVPTFEIGLNVLNPNPGAINLEGIVYEVSIQGHEILKGAGKDFPVVEGYSSQAVKLTAVANLLSGIRLLGDLMNMQDDELEYEFEARLDTGGFFPAIRVSESGSFRMDGAASGAQPEN
ncbi:MAG: LEA type 2 family protein [Lysobacterales bacterium]|jgi:LEA14-like dessication related protein